MAPGEKPARSSRTCALSTAAFGSFDGLPENAAPFTRSGVNACVSPAPAVYAASAANRTGAATPITAIIIFRHIARPQPALQINETARLPVPDSRLEAERIGTMSEPDRSEEQRLMRDSCRAFVDEVVLPFIRGNWQREW